MELNHHSIGFHSVFGKMKQFKVHGDISLCCLVEWHSKS